MDVYNYINGGWEDFPPAAGRFLQRKPIKPHALLVGRDGRVGKAASD